MSHTWIRLPPFDDEEMSNEENPRVFLDISINGRPAAERIEIELFANVVPKTAENFRALCTGERGYGSITGRRLHYKGTVFHRICKGFLAQGGDISEEQNGEGGESIYGGYFPNENFQLSHSVPGMLSMAHGFRKGNGSQFFITFRRHPFLDGCHVVFGKVREGMGTLYKINQLGTPGGQPAGLVQITDCGEIKNNVMESDKGKKENTTKRASSSEGLVQITDCGEIKNNVMESDIGKKKKTLKRASSSDGLVEELSDERKKQRKYSSSRPSDSGSSSSSDGTRSKKRDRAQNKNKRKTLTARRSKRKSKWYPPRPWWMAKSP